MKKFMRAHAHTYARTTEIWNGKFAHLHSWQVNVPKKTLKFYMLTLTCILYMI